VLAEGALEDWLRGERLRRDEAVTGEKKAAVLIRNRQGIAGHPVPRAELPFEVSRPEIRSSSAREVG